MTGHRVEDFLSQESVLPIIVFYEFSNNMICSNEVFNDINWQSPVDLLLVKKKERQTKRIPMANTKLPVELYGNWKLLVRITFKFK